MAMSTPGSSGHTSMTWLLFALITVASWGVYGVFLHKGQHLMTPAGAAMDPNARFKAFLWVGIAYFLTAVLAPLAILVINGATWKMPAGGVTWSLLAGIVGAFCVLLAFGAAPAPKYLYVPVVMSIIFAGAPIVNAVVSTTIEKNWSNIHWQFLAGIVLAAAGGCLVVLYKPSAPPGHGTGRPAVVQPAPPGGAASAARVQPIAAPLPGDDPPRISDEPGI